MLANIAPPPQVKAVLKVAMIFDHEPREKGEVVTMPLREFKYLHHHNRVAEASPENVKAVLAEVKAEKEAEERAGAHLDELSSLRAALAAANAENERLRKGK